MTWRWWRRPPPGSEAERRLRGALAEAGLVGSRRGLRGGEVGRRLRQVLEGLGGVAAAFGRHLSTRADLLALEDAAALAGTALPVRGWGAAEVRARAARLALTELEEQPRRLGPFHQRQAARLASGERVELVLLLPEWELRPEVGWLRALEPALPGAADALEDFAESLAQRCDLGRQARDLERLAEDVRASGVLTVPRVHALSSGQLLVLADLEGRVLEPAPAGEAPAAGARDQARLLSAAFFGLALIDGVLLEEPRLADFQLLPGERLGFGSGPLRRLEDDPRRRLLAWVSAAAREEPDAVWAALLRLARAGAPDLDRAELRLRLRQAEPLRASVGFERYQGRRLVHSLALQWRLLRVCGGRPRPELTAFAQAALALERSASDLAPEHDAPAEGLADVRLVAAVAELRELFAPTRLAATLSRCLPPLLELAQHAERLAPRDAHDEGREPEPGWAALWPRLALVGAAGLLAPSLLSVLGRPWDQRVSAGLLLAAGALLLGWLRGEAPAGTARSRREP